MSRSILRLSSDTVVTGQKQGSRATDTTANTAQIQRLTKYHDDTPPVDGGKGTDIDPTDLDSR